MFFWPTAPSIADSFTDFAQRLMRALEDGTPLIYWLQRDLGVAESSGCLTC